MAYENGYEATNYIGECIERYRKDPLIFFKTLQLISIFMARPDWPHCVDDLDKAVAGMLGNTLTDIVYSFTDKYLEDEKIIWPEDLPSEFKENLKAFHLATSPILNQAWSARTGSAKLFSIAYSDNPFGPSVMRLIRVDGAFLDVELEPHTVDALIKFLEEYRREKQQGESV